MIINTPFIIYLVTVYIIGFIIGCIHLYKVYLVDGDDIFYTGLAWFFSPILIPAITVAGILVLLAMAPGLFMYGVVSTINLVKKGSNEW